MRRSRTSFYGLTDRWLVECGMWRERLGLGWDGMGYGGLCVAVVETPID